jgi:N6-L-threonylcarbamoyladenine synthase
MKILGIETSCDETGVAVMEDGRIVLAEKLASSIDLQQKYGGVVPELASRVHAEKIIPLIRAGLKEANCNLNEIEAIAVANGPGLVGALLVGTMTAKTLAMVTGKKLIAVNHLEGHIASVFLPNSKTGENHLSMVNFQKSWFPMLVLIVSGGHTELVLMLDFGVYQMIGETIDDAAGEAFDKAAKILGLDYPGGPSIARAAENRIRNTEFRKQKMDLVLPRPMVDSGDLNFSFSGLKTALLYKVKKIGEKNMGDDLVNQLAFEFQEAVTDVLVAKTVQAANEYQSKKVAIVGGVAANRVLRGKMEAVIGDKLIIPDFKYCTDNGVKIAVAGYYKYKKGELADWREMEVKSNWILGE